MYVIYNVFTISQATQIHSDLLPYSVADSATMLYSSSVVSIWFDSSILKIDVAKHIFQSI